MNMDELSSLYAKMKANPKDPEVRKRILREAYSLPLDDKDLFHYALTMLMQDAETARRRIVLVNRGKSWLMATLGWLLYFWSGTRRENFRTGFTTTIPIPIYGARIYMPEHLFGTARGYVVLRHERTHILDAFAWPIWFQLSYLFLPLPFFFTFRSKWEMKAYMAEPAYYFQALGAVPSGYAKRIAAIFTGPECLWMGVGTKGYEEELERSIAAHEYLVSVIVDSTILVVEETMKEYRKEVTEHGTFAVMPVAGQA